MPSPPKDRPSGRLGRFLAALRPSRAGPLPVQTGFPTSLADLVVKNHGRLKKQPSPSSKRGKRGAAASPSPTTSPPPASPPPPPPPPAAAVVIYSSDQGRPDLAPARPARGGKGGSFGLGLGFLAVSGVVSLALLVIWSKKVVATVTVAAFSLFLLESVRSSLRPRRPRPAAAETRLYLDGRGRVSPIREVDAETEPSRPSCSDTDRGSEVSVLAVEDKSGALLDESSTPKAKTKKRSWKKLIASAKKLGPKSKEADSPGSFRSDDGDRAVDASVRGGNAKATDPSDSRRGAANQTDAAVAREPDSQRGSRRSQGTEIVAAPVEIDDAPVAFIEEEAVEEVGRAGSRFPAALVLVAVVLVGLVAGKLPAVALTVLCYAFFSSVQGLPCGGGSSAGRRSELSLS
ncbi:hypothetical protein BAE44_0014370 [Dichanthelium oligosanthes]|uniref:Uncharacterized protein n=1 Tax=Dichanthelium oligosanthes TaxID=888268 RepID=A0A1E5VHM2_9POAL|nr:hypothetical protein BAE44_0014370 [Dichanthelium oligosanthes]